MFIHCHARIRFIVVHTITSYVTLESIFDVVKILFVVVLPYRRFGILNYFLAKYHS